jgi:glycosyltransferase involved in cell wall biosynthesis
LERLVPEILSGHRDAQIICWLYTPLALPLVDAIAPDVLVYDCMDELSAFRFAPPALLSREAELMRRADLVLTGGPSLYEARKERHHNVHCFPSSVDARHFAPRPHLADAAPSKEARSLHQTTEPPRLGFFGVIDERMDLELIAKIADRFPAADVVMVGPVVKIDPASIPQRPNLHWLGQRSYDVLPRLVEQWQVCLMPFALNESTRFISPTKTLEYLAAGKPVVSTAVHDVEVLYKDVVRIGRDHESFLDACAAALAETGEARRAGQLAGAAVVQRSSWEATARRISEEMEACLLAKSTRAPVARSGRQGVSRVSMRSA